jgi:hypothetical protein
MIGAVTGGYRQPGGAPARRGSQGQDRAGTKVACDAEEDSNGNRPGTEAYKNLANFDVPLKGANDRLNQDTDSEIRKDINKLFPEIGSQLHNDSHKIIHHFSTFLD